MSLWIIVKSVFNLLSPQVFERRSSAYASLYLLHYTFGNFNIFKSVRNNAFKVYFVNIILRFPLFVSTAVNSIISTEWRAYCLLMFLFFHYFYNDKRAIQCICHGHNYAVHRNVIEPKRKYGEVQKMWYELNYYFAYTSARTFSP